MSVNVEEILSLSLYLSHINVQKKLSLTFGLLHMRWFNVCCLCVICILLRLKIFIKPVTPALCSNGQNFPAKRLRKILACQIRMRQLFFLNKFKTLKSNTPQQINGNRTFIVFLHFNYPVIVTRKARCVSPGQVLIKTSVYCCCGRPG